MKKIFLSFGLIVALALFATFSRRNIGVGADRFLTSNISVLGGTTTSEPVVPQPTTSVVSTPKSNTIIRHGDDEEEDFVRTPVSSPAPAPTPSPTPASVSSPTPTQTGKYKNGTYTGSVADAYYGNIQVQAVIQGGKLTDVVFLQYPNDRSTSIEINTQAMPYLKSEAIQIQSGNVNIVSGATDSSVAFRQSMSSALSQALN